jgi:nucleoside-diphosphate-sugar epimerase
MGVNLLHEGGNSVLFVTGITGHTGKWFLDRLIKGNYSGRIRCLVRENSNTTMLDNSGLDIEKVYGCLEDIGLLESAMAGVTTVLHISSILFSKNVMNAAIKNNVKWAVLIHTTGRYSKYKSASEEYIQIEDEILKKRNQIGITILRPTMIYGSVQDRNMYKLIDYLHTHKVFPLFGNGKNLMQPVLAKDLGNAYYDVLINREKTFNQQYNLPGKMPIRYIDLVRCVSNILERKNIILKLPLWFSIVSIKVYNSISKNPLISIEQVLRMQEDKDFIYEAATKDFNYSPVSFEEGIKDEIEQYLTNARIEK